MMYHCMPIDFRSPLDAKPLENVCHTKLHELVDHREKHSKERHRSDDHPGGRHHVFAARPGNLLHLHANVVQEFARACDRAGNFFADAGRCSGDGAALQFFVLPFDRLHGHESSFSTVGQPFLPVLFICVPAGPGHRNSGRGGGIRTPIPGFGDRSPSRWTTPLNSKPACPSPHENDPCENKKLLHFLVCRLLAARVAEFLCFQPLGVLLFVLRCRVVAVFAIAALQCNDLAHDLRPFQKPKTLRLKNQTYSMISVTAPAPTVWPPSRIANRRPFSSATGVIKATSQLTLSPGITISTPAGSFTSPVTSVVRK